MFAPWYAHDGRWERRSPNLPGVFEIPVWSWLLPKQWQPFDKSLGSWHKHAGDKAKPLNQPREQSEISQESHGNKKSVRIRRPEFSLNPSVHLEPLRMVLESD